MSPPDKKTKLSFSRRDFMKAAPLVGLTAGAAALQWIETPSTHDLNSTRRLRGVCRICTMHCGVMGFVRRGRLVRVEGDIRAPSRGFLCMHGRALPQIVHSSERLPCPLKRENKKFREVSWEQALQEISQKIRHLQSQYGPQCIAVHTGWPFVRHPLVPFLQRFCYALGTPNFSTVASLCEAALRMGKALTVGSNFSPDLPNTRTLILWGINPPRSAPPVAHLLAAKTSPGHNLIVVDPVRTQLATQATEHLQILPGTDCALALGLIHVLFQEKLYDSEFVENYTVGEEKLRSIVEKYPPKRVEQITSVPKEKIVRVARMFAQQKPSAVWDGLGIEHHDNCFQTIRAVAILQALCGVIDTPGGGRLVNKPGPNFYSERLPAFFRLATAQPVPPIPQVKPIGYDQYPIYEIFHRQAQANLYPQAILDDKPYPLRGLILVGCNALVTWPNSIRVKQALQKLPLLVSVDPFPTATGELAHYQLPSSTFAESATLPSENEARSNLVKEQKESWPDWKIFFQLAQGLGMGMEKYFPWKSFSEALNAPRVYYGDDPQRCIKPIPPENQASRPRFPTRTGKVEIYSELMAQWGAGVPAIPDYLPAGEQPNDQYPLVLLTGRRTQAYINSQFRNIYAIRGQMPEPIVEIHPQTAARAGVRENSAALVVSPHGKAVFTVRIKERIHPRIAVIPAGWAQANANLLIGEKLDPVTGFPAFRSGICQVIPASRG